LSGAVKPIALDDARRLKVVERGAVEGLVGLQVEASPDVGQRGQGSIAKRSRKVDGATNRLEVREAGDIGVQAVVGNLETATNGSESREGSIGELVVADNGQVAAY